MKIESVYHVVTERPMELGQKIIFDRNHHNGVYRRVTTFLKISRGEPIRGDLADLIRSDLDKWAKVAYRELALEKVRAEQFSAYPSRMACLYTSRTLEEAQSWARFFQEIGRDVYSIVKLRVQGGSFDGDACNCFDGGTDEEENLKKARRYWENKTNNKKSVIETLVDGTLTVDEIVLNFNAGAPA